MRQIKTFVKAVPPLLLVMDGIAFIFAHLKMSWIKDFMWFHREMFGHSISLLVYIIYFSYRFKVCKYTWTAIICLVLLNLLNLLYYFLPLDYYELYAGILAFYGITILILYAFQPNTPNSPGRII